MRTVIIGGGSAGTSAAFFLRKLDKEMDITIIEKTGNLEHSPCAMPYVISGEIPDKDSIFIFKEKDYCDSTISLKRYTEAVSIDRKNKRVLLSDSSAVPYDKLIIAVGSRPVVPKIKGIENAMPFRTLADMDALKSKLQEKKRIGIIGAGLVGTELSYALLHAGHEPILADCRDRVLAGMLDSQMSGIIEADMRDKGIELLLGCTIREITTESIVCERTVSCGILLYCAGFMPDTGLAEKAGLEIDVGIVVDDDLRTSDPDIYACGDCVITRSIITEKNEKSMLGSVAVRQAKAIAEGVTGRKADYKGNVNATITRLGDLYIGSVGITKEKAASLGMKPVIAAYSGKVTSEYYPAKDSVDCMLIADSKGMLLGGQLVSSANVAGWVNLLSLAMSERIAVRKLAGLEACYNPASASINDPIVSAAEILVKKLAARP